MRADSCFQKAVEYQIKNPNLTVGDAMKLANFSLWEERISQSICGVIACEHEPDSLKGVTTHIKVT